MKLTPMISTLGLATILASQATVADPKKANDVQRVTTFTAAAVAGGIAGGPIGLVIGAIGGALLDNQSKKAIATKDELIMAEQEVALLESTIDAQEEQVNDLESRIAQRLEFQVMFPTGDDQLSFQDIKRIESLAKYLDENQQLTIRLDGHADPRGTDEYNNVLSSERAKTVAQALIERGVEASRIHIHSHGSDFATTIEANRDNYAFERRVNIEVYAEQSNNVATAN